jgi:hypothetical protein
MKTIHQKVVSGKLDQIRKLKKPFSDSEVKSALRLISMLISLIECMDELSDTPMYKQKIKYLSKILLVEIEQYIQEMWANYMRDEYTQLTVQRVNQIYHDFNQLLSVVDLMKYDDLHDRILKIKEQTIQLNEHNKHIEDNRLNEQSNPDGTNPS